MRSGVPDRFLLCSANVSRVIVTPTVSGVTIERVQANATPGLLVTTIWGLRTATFGRVARLSVDCSINAPYVSCVRLRRSLIVGGVLAAVIAILPSPTAAQTSNGCDDVLFLGLRGSGQTEIDAGGFGPQVAETLSIFQARMDSARLSVDATPISYPSEGVEVLAQDIFLDHDHDVLRRRRSRDRATPPPDPPITAILRLPTRDRRGGLFPRRPRYTQRVSAANDRSARGDRLYGPAVRSSAYWQLGCGSWQRTGQPQWRLPNCRGSGPRHPG